MVLGVKELAVGYRGTPLVSGLSFGVEAGELMVVLGPNGAGKSTILKTVLGELPALRGEITLEGRPLNAYTKEEAAARMAAVFTARIRPEYMTAYDVVAAGRYPYTDRTGRLSARDVAAVEEALLALWAKDLGPRPFDELSDGQKQRVLIARAIAQEPSLLILDEPFSYLDIRYQAELAAALKTLMREKNTAILMTLHEISIAKKIADRVLLLSEDHTHSTGAPQALMTEEALRRLFSVGEDPYGIASFDV